MAVIGEIDIMEHVKQNPRSIIRYILSLYTYDLNIKDPSNTAQVTQLSGLEHLRFRMERDKLTFFVNGQETFLFKPETGE